MNHEPVANAGSLSALLIVLANATVGLLTALGYVHWDTNQQAAVNAFVLAVINVAAVLVPTFWARSKVTALTDPKVELDDGTIVPLVRADNAQPPPQASTRAYLRRL